MKYYTENLTDIKPTIHIANIHKNTPPININICVNSERNIVSKKITK